MEFLTRIEVRLPPDLTADQRGELMAREREVSARLAEQGVQKRLWRVPGRRAVWGLWEAQSTTLLHEALSSLALFPWMDIEVHSLADHPNDPQ